MQKYEHSDKSYYQESRQNLKVEVTAKNFCYPRKGLVTRNTRVKKALGFPLQN